MYYEYDGMPVLCFIAVNRHLCIFHRLNIWIFRPRQQAYITFMPASRKVGIKKKKPKTLINSKRKKGFKYYSSQHCGILSIVTYLNILL